MGEDGNFCKHCVAVGLAWLHQPNDKRLASKSSLQTFLENMDHQQLVELVLSAASNNRRLRDKLEFAEAAAAGPDLSIFRKAITDATRTAGIDYYSMPRFARRVLDLITSLRTLLEAGQGTTAFKFELNSECELLYGASATYADLLGETGLHEYRRLTEDLRSKLPALKPGDNGHERYGTRFRITSMMETLARQSEDLDALITIKQRDLTHPYSFLQIAELYREDFFDYATSLRVEYKRKRNFIQMLDRLLI